jgi:hypothetical protein
MDQINDLNDPRLQARCFLETKAYEHQTWPHAVRQMSSVLLDKSEDQWDAAWLSDLHLMSVVMRDARQASVHIGQDANGAMPLSDILEELSKRDKNRFLRLLASLASYDAPAAFRMAEVAGIDLAEHAPNVITEHCDEPPFLALVVDEARRDAVRTDLWARIITKAALESRAAAFLIMDYEPMDSWKSAVSALEPRARWFGRDLLPQTLLSEALSITLASRAADDPPSYDALRRFRRITLRYLPRPELLTAVVLSALIAAAIVMNISAMIAFTLALLGVTGGFLALVSSDVRAMSQSVMFSEPKALFLLERVERNISRRYPGKNVARGARLLVVLYSPLFSLIGTVAMRMFPYEAFFELRERTRNRGEAGNP